MSKDETVKVVINTMINDSAMNAMIADIARRMVDTGCPLPEEFEDIFSIEIVTRPSGSKYARVSFI